MNDECRRIWEAALPYQDKREDPGHGRIVTAFAEELLQTEDGTESVVIPAAILHDIGWSQIPRDTLMRLFDYQPGSEEEKELRLRHQRDGMKLAKNILKQAQYNVIEVRDIIEIISQHDTRDGLLNQNDAIVRDADKLWMFSQDGFRADLERRKLSPDEWSLYLEQVIEKKFFTETARNIARRELGLRMEEFA